MRKEVMEQVKVEEKNIVCRQSDFCLEGGGKQLNVFAKKVSKSNLGGTNKWENVLYCYLL